MGKDPVLEAKRERIVTIIRLILVIVGVVLALLGISGMLGSIAMEPQLGLYLSVAGLALALTGLLKSAFFLEFLS